MQRCWPPEDLAEHWTLTADELRLLDPKTDHNRLGFALLLKFFTIEGRFPRSLAEVPEAAGSSLTSGFQQRIQGLHRRR